MRRAARSDIPTLVALMAEFYAESAFELDRSVAEAAFASILGEERLGGVWLIESDGEAVGHVVMTLRFGMEFAGLIACVDDLYVRPSHRKQGLATKALAELRDLCKARGVRAMTVEVGDDNVAAQAAYRRLGFEEASNRQLLSLALAAPAHAV